MALGATALRFALLFDVPVQGNPYVHRQWVIIPLAADQSTDIHRRFLPENCAYVCAYGRGIIVIPEKTEHIPHDFHFFIRHPDSPP